MRKWLLLALLLMTTGLGVGLYFWQFEQPAQAQALALDRNLLALLPPNSTSLVGVDVARLKQTPVYRHIEEESRRSGGSKRNDLEEFVAKTGFDPRQDVDEMLVASYEDPSQQDSDSQFVAVARGRFNLSSLKGELRARGATVETYKGFEIFGPENRPSRSRRPGSSREEQGRFTFLDEKTALAGTRSAVLAAIDRKLSGGPSLLANTALLGRAQNISGSNQVWAVSDRPGQVITRAIPRKHAPQGSNFARIFSSMQNSTFALDLMNGVDLRAAGLCKTTQDAKALADAARGIVALGRLSASQNEPELMAVFDNIQVDDRDTELNISVRIDLPTFEKLLEKGRSRGRTVTARF